MSKFYSDPIYSAFHDLLAFIKLTTFQVARCQQALTSHDVHYENSLALLPIENPAGKFDNLTVARVLELGRSWTQAGVSLEFADVRENTLHKLRSSNWIFDSDIVGDGLEIR